MPVGGALCFNNQRAEDTLSASHMSVNPTFYLFFSFFPLINWSSAGYSHQKSCCPLVKKVLYLPENHFIHNSKIPECLHVAIKSQIPSPDILDGELVPRDGKKMTRVDLTGD